MWIPHRVTQRVMERFTVEDECWVSDYSVGSHGYAQVGWYVRGQQTMTLAHRVAYLAVNGPIPNDLTVDHICHNRRCINPGHLRLLSPTTSQLITSATTDDASTQAIFGCCPTSTTVAGTDNQTRPIVPPVTPTRDPTFTPTPKGTAAVASARATPTALARTSAPSPTPLAVSPTPRADRDPVGHPHPAGDRRYEEMDLA